MWRRRLPRRAWCTMRSLRLRTQPQTAHSATESVVHNAQFAAAYGGMHHFAPMEVMYQRTSLAVMGALLVHDIMNAEGAANPKSEAAKAFRNPFELFAVGSFHGGVQRCSFKINDIGVPSALAFYVTQYKVPMV